MPFMNNIYLLPDFDTFMCLIIREKTILWKPVRPAPYVVPTPALRFLPILNNNKK